MWDLVTLKRLNDEEVNKRKRAAEVKAGMIAQSFGTPKPITLKRYNEKKKGD